MKNIKIDMTRITIALLLLWLAPGYAQQPISDHKDKTTPDDVATILSGVWSNKREGFAEVVIVFYPSGKGLLNYGPSAALFNWKALADGKITTEFFPKSTPPLTLLFDKSSKLVRLLNGEKQERFIKTDLPIPESPIERALKNQQARAEKFLQKNYDRHLEQGITLKRASALFIDEAQKDRDFSYSLIDSLSTTKTPAVFSRRGQKIQVTMTIDAAIDKAFPFAFRKTERRDSAILDSTIPATTIISAEKMAQIQQYLTTNSIPYKTAYNRYEYYWGYKIGYSHFLEINLAANNDNYRRLADFITMLFKDIPKVNVSVMRKKAGATK